MSGGFHAAGDEDDLASMPFSALSDPIDIARTYAAEEQAWSTLRARHFVPQDVEHARKMLRDIVAGNMRFAANDHDLVRRSVDGFLTNRRNI